jgi:hypothetical protein
VNEERKWPFFIDETHRKVQDGKPRRKDMKIIRMTLALTAAALLFASCTTFKASGLSVVPSDQSYTVIGDFHTQVWVHEFLGSPAGVKLFNITATNTEDPIKAAIAKAVKVKGGTGAINITIVHEASFPDILLSWITWTIYSPGNVKISGTVIK